MSIVFGTTLQPESEPFAELAALLAQRMGVPLHLVHVCEGVAYPVAPGTVAKPVVDPLHERAAQLAERLHARTGAAVHPHVATGSVVDELVSLAELERATALLLGFGSSGSGRPRTRTAERAAKTSSVPVLALRAPQRLAAWLRGQAPLRVLVGADLGRAAQAARAFAVRLAGLGACEVEVIHIVSSPPDLHARMGLCAAPDEAGLVPQAEAALRQHFSRSAPAGEDPATLRLVVAPGPVAMHLVSRASGADFDLVVVGQHRYSLLEQLWRGSVAYEALQDVPVTVACVPPSHESAWSVPPPQVVVVGMDFSEVAEQALAQAIALVAPGGTVHVGHVVTTTTSSDRAPAEQARVTLARLRARDPARAVTLEPHVLEGPAAIELLALAERTAADLLVVGARRSRSAIQRAVLGSVAQELVTDARVPVMLVPLALP